jgi:phytoene dehydrogenase-like protein
VERLTIVGAGVSGLVAAIEAAEQGWSVTVREARSRAGGRARTLGGPFRANLGPHALYRDGPLWDWLCERGLVPPVVAAPRASTLYRAWGRLGPWPDSLTIALAALPVEAPAEAPFRSWLRRYIEPSLAEAVVGLMFITTYDHDPGRLSAAFVNERLGRTRGDVVRYVVGGWGNLIARLVERATELGVETRFSDRVRALPEQPTIVATRLGEARRLTGDGSLEWTGARTALLDLGLQAADDIGWVRVLDLDDRIYMARYSRTDPSLAPAGSELVQIAAACRPDERRDGVWCRVEQLLDVAWPGWRMRAQWRRGYVLEGQTGAVDLPGTSWQDRPTIRRGPALWVATDQSAAPGFLAEVGAAAARTAVRTLGR